MRLRWIAVLALAWPLADVAAIRGKKEPEPRFQASERCIACHNGLVSSTGEDVSIGFDWRSSVMANSSRDPYWQASSRRETLDHPEVQAVIQDECSVCHMPIPRYEAKLKGQLGQIFKYLPFDDDKRPGQEAIDGVDCSVCHQITAQNFGTRESFNGGFVVAAPESPQNHPEYGPFQIQQGRKRVMQSSSNGFLPEEQLHIRKSELCATCHTLYTQARGAGGKVIGELPEQMPFLEWEHSDYRDQQSCQYCHMPEVKGPAAITAVFGVKREGLHRHTFLGGNFFMERVLNRYRDDLQVGALPQELQHSEERTLGFLRSQAAKVRIERLAIEGGRVQADVSVENLGGHKLPTAFPSRRAWLYVTVKDSDGRVLFESGKMRPSGFIEGNDNDEDKTKYEPHYREITRSDQVEIYEDILGDENGNVTTGLLQGVRYLKDNRILPHGFDKATASKDIAVVGDAEHDPGFTGQGSRVRYSVATDGPGPFQVTVELWYQPIGYRWANNLKPYDKAAEPHRFNGIYDAMGPATGVVLARAEGIAH